TVVEKANDRPTEPLLASAHTVSIALRWTPSIGATDVSVTRPAHHPPTAAANISVVTIITVRSLGPDRRRAIRNEAPGGSGRFIEESLLRRRSSSRAVVSSKAAEE